MPATAIPQGDIRLLADDVARRLLTSTESQRRYYGEEQAAASLAEVDRPGLRMARIALRPSWVGVLDFRTRFPGGAGPEKFQRRERR